MQRSNLFVDAKLVIYQITNTKYEFPHYGFKSVQGYGDMVAKGLISEDEYKAFTADMDYLASSGDYLFCITTFIYVPKRAEDITAHVLLPAQEIHRFGSLPQSPP